MDGTNKMKDTARVSAPVASKPLSVNVFTAPGITHISRVSRTVAL
jgi:hypothetical protein